MIMIASYIRKVASRDGNSNVLASIDRKWEVTEMRENGTWKINYFILRDIHLIVRGIVFFIDFGHVFSLPCKPRITALS